MSQQNRVRKLINRDITKEITLLQAVGLKQITPNTCILTYARMNRCYNEQGSRTIYVCSSIPHCISRSI
jgi:hypothetical protein